MCIDMIKFVKKKKYKVYCYLGYKYWFILFVCMNDDDGYFIIGEILL